MHIRFFFFNTKDKTSPHKFNISAETSKCKGYFYPFNLIFNADFQKINAEIPFTSLVWSSVYVPIEHLSKTLIKLC